VIDCCLCYAPAAGARTVVATLWNVDDLSTAQFMKSFYRRLSAGQDPDGALG
jgi:CHAT domain-containing protein